MKQIEIFKTSICKNHQAVAIIKCLQQYFPHYQINFDLEDCDRILRIETQRNDINNKTIEGIVIARGYSCSHLPG
jgi:hypothetical protein